MSEMSPQRKKVVILCACVASLSGAGPLLTKGHPKLAMAWTAFILVALVFAITQFVKLKRSER
jgi:hypothetical protein